MGLLLLELVVECSDNSESDKLSVDELPSLTFNFSCNYYLLSIKNENIVIIEGLLKANIYILINLH